MIKTVEHNNIKWHHIHNASREDRRFLEKNFNFHQLVLDDVFSYQQRPKIDAYETYIFFVIHMPVLEGQIKIREVDFFIGPDYLITTTTKHYMLLENLFSQAQNNEQLRETLFKNNPSFLFYNLLDKFIASVFPIINQLGSEIETIDRGLIKQNIARVIEKINLTRRNLVVLHTLIKPELDILHDMEQGKIKFLDQKMSVYWGDLLDHLKKIYDQVDDYRELIEGLAVSSESLISHKTNEIIKILTIFSVIVLPLTLIASIYGMNIPLPIQKNALALPILVVIMIMVIGGMMIYFKLKRWF